MKCMMMPMTQMINARSDRKQNVETTFRALLSLLQSLHARNCSQNVQVIKQFVWEHHNLVNCNFAAALFKDSLQNFSDIPEEIS